MHYPPSKKSYLCLCLSLYLALSALGKGPVLELTDFGYDPETADHTPALLRALEAAREQKASKLNLVPGTLRCLNDRALEHYMAISNNDNGLNRVVFLLEDMHDFEIDGRGANLLFVGPMVPFALEHCSNITLRNFTIDWEKPFHTEARVVAANPEARTFDIRIEAPFQYAIHHDRLYFDSPRGTYDVRVNLFFYPDGGSTVHNVNTYKMATWERWVNDFYTAEELEPGLVRIHSSEVHRIPEPGWVWVIKGKEGERRSVAIRLFRAANVLIEDVELYHSGGMGIIGEKSEDITMRRLQVKPAPSSGRAVSTTADATHFVNCKGQIIFEDCTFSHMLDDATNVHGIYVKAIDILSENRVGVQQVHYQQHGFDFADVGDEIEFIDNQTLMPVGRATVTEVRWLNSEYQELAFDQPVGDWIESDFGLENVSWSAGLTFRNCIVKKNRARGILFSTRGKVLVEGSTFSNMMAGISVSGDTNYWFESGPCLDVTLRDNTFINCTTGGKGNAVIMFAPIIKSPELAEGYYHRDVTIERNTFTAFDAAILYALSVDGLTFRENRIFHDPNLLPLFPDKATFEIMGSKDVRIESNSFNPVQDGSILTDRNTAKTLHLKDNDNRTGKTLVQNEAENKYDVL